MSCSSSLAPDRAEGVRRHRRRANSRASQPVDVVEVVWERPPASAIPLPARLGGRRSVLRRAVSPSSGCPRAGLLRHHRRRGAPHRPRRRRTGGRQDHPGGPRRPRRGSTPGPPWPWAAATRTSARPTGPSPTSRPPRRGPLPSSCSEAHVAVHGRSLLPLVPDLGDRVGDLPGPHHVDLESERFLLFAAVADLLAALGRVAATGRVPRRPPLGRRRHRLAPATLAGRSRAGPGAHRRHDAHRRAHRRPPHGPGAGGAATRPGRHPGGARRAGQRRRGRPRRALDRHRFARPATERLADALVAETGGNAFFVTELVRHLDETGQLRRAGRRAADGRLARARQPPRGAGRARGPPRLGGRLGARRRRRDRQRVHPPARRAVTGVDERQGARRARRGGRRRARAGGRPTRRASSRSPTRSCSTPSWPTSAPPARPPCTDGWPSSSRWTTSRGSASPPSPTTGPGHQRVGHGPGPRLGAPGR